MSQPTPPPPLVLIHPWAQVYLSLGAVPPYGAHLKYRPAQCPSRLRVFGFLPRQPSVPL